jgi:hypothetical protein
MRGCSGVCITGKCDSPCREMEAHRERQEREERERWDRYLRDNQISRDPEEDDSDGTGGGRS